MNSSGALTIVSAPVFSCFSCDFIDLVGIFGALESVSGGSRLADTHHSHEIFDLEGSFLPVCEHEA